MDRKIRYFVNGWSFRLSFATRPGYDGDHEDISDGDSYELGEYENSEEALAAAEAFISTHGNEVNDEEDGIGSVIYWTVEVERRVEYKENEWLPCDESGRIDDGYGNEPNATVAYLSSLEGSREERAFERGCTHHGHHEPVHVVHGKALQAGGCRRPHRIRVDGQGARVACRRARDACRAAMARTMARSRVDTCLGRVKRCFSHALIFAA